MLLAITATPQTNKNKKHWLFYKQQTVWEIKFIISRVTYAAHKQINWESDIEPQLQHIHKQIERNQMWNLQSVWQIHKQIEKSNMKSLLQPFHKQIEKSHTESPV
jgi:hypothetical protein